MIYCGVWFTILIYFSCEASCKFPIKDIFHNSGDVAVNEENYLCSINSRYKGNKCCECTRGCMKSKTCSIDTLWNADKPVLLKNIWIYSSKKQINTKILTANLFSQSSTEMIKITQVKIFSWFQHSRSCKAYRQRGMQNVN